MTFFETVRGVEVEIHCEDWDGDLSVDIEYGPESVYATTLDKGDFELTEEEIDRFAIRASEAVWHDTPD